MALNPEYPASAVARVSVVRGSDRVPLLAASQNQLPVRRQPWSGVVLERHRVQPGEIPRHEHPELCLHLQVSGEDGFEWWHGGKNAIEATRPGALILIPPGTEDRLRWIGTSERLILSIDNAALERTALQLGAKQTPEILGAWCAFDPALRSLISEMGREASENWPLGALYADLLALSLETALIRHHSTSTALPSLQGGLSLPRLKRAMELMSGSLADDLGLGQIARAMDLSPSHFAHEFRNATGTTPYQYLLQQRLERARVLLRTTRLPIQMVGILCGFKYAANFVRTFRQREGVTPEAWRRGSSTVSAARRSFSRVPPAS